MSTNNCFSFARLGMVMKRDLMENWKKNLYRFLGPYAGILFVMVVCSMNMTNFKEFTSIVCGAFVSVLFFGGIINASYIMEPMDTQQKRISFLMLPATTLEKFISRGLYATLVFALVATLALVLAEITRYTLLPIFDLPDSFKQSTLPDIFTSLYIFADSSSVTWSNTWPEEQPYSILMGQICSLLYIGWMHSFYILGGCYWQKHPFWKTLGIMILAHILIPAGFVNLIIQLSDNNWEMYHEHFEFIFEGITINQSLTFFSIVFLVLILLNWWLSYRCFKRSQVIKPKFHLL